MGTDTKKREKMLRGREDFLFMVWFLWMAVYYGFRMFSLTPWYDELYTYYYFISRGPLYAAIHWPLPNNHVGYSVLSGILDWFGNPYIGLRGISYLSALANLFLLYQIGKKIWKREWAFCCVALYSCMNLVNQLAVQGRGYTLATACCLVSLFMLQKIGFGADGEKVRTGYYVIFSLSLTLGLYVLPSSVYWVLPICAAGGFFLLLRKKKKELLHLVGASVAAAVNTTVLYALIWLAVGSNLMSKAEGGMYFGRGHVSIILSAPFQVLKTGMDYMLATPYIQSVAREGYFREFALWLRSLLDYYYSNAGIFLAVVIVAGCIVTAAAGVKAYREGKQEALFFPVFIIAMMVLTPVILVVQCKLPYFRVFSYMGIPLAMLLCALLQKSCSFISVIIERRRISPQKPSGVNKPVTGVKTEIWAGAAGILSVVLLLSGDYNNEYGMTEYYAKDALAHADVEEKGVLCVTDCYQQYLLRFGYGIECENMQVEGADLVLVHREMELQEPDAFRWEFYQNYETIPWEYIKGMNIVYENEEYTVYTR